jgi:hypothetical protein
MLDLEGGLVNRYFLKHRLQSRIPGTAQKAERGYLENQAGGKLRRLLPLFPYLTFRENVPTWKNLVLVRLLILVLRAGLAHISIVFLSWTPGVFYAMLTAHRLRLENCYV